MTPPDGQDVGGTAAATPQLLLAKVVNQLSGQGAGFSSEDSTQGSLHGFFRARSKNPENFVFEDLVSILVREIRLLSS